jgi:hypothetical protein
LILGKAEIFHLSALFRLVLDPSKSPVYWIEGVSVFGRGLKGPGLEAAPLPSSAALVRMCGAILPFLHVSSWLDV